MALSGNDHTWWDFLDYCLCIVHWVNIYQRQLFVLTFTPKTSLESPVHLNACDWTVGGSRSTQREPMYTMSRTCKIITEKPPAPKGFEAGTFFHNFGIHQCISVLVFSHSNLLGVLPSQSVCLVNSCKSLLSALLQVIIRSFFILCLLYLLFHRVDYSMLLPVVFSPLSPLPATAESSYLIFFPRRRMWKYLLTILSLSLLLPEYHTSPY